MILLSMIIVKTFKLPLSILAAVELTDGFPYDQPSLILRSVYHRLHGVPCQCITTDSPYSARWNSDEHAERIRYVFIDWLHIYTRVTHKFRRQKIDFFPTFTALEAPSASKQVILAGLVVLLPTRQE